MYAVRVGLSIYYRHAKIEYIAYVEARRVLFLPRKNGASGKVNVSLELSGARSSQFKLSGVFYTGAGVFYTGAGVFYTARPGV